MSRRQFGATVAAGLGSSAARLRRAGYGPPPTRPGRSTATAVSIDALANPGAMNVPWPPRGPLTPAQRGHIAKSGLTAINITVSADDFEGTVENIALWTGEAASTRSCCQGTPARRHRSRPEGGTLGVIHGFQNTAVDTSATSAASTPSAISASASSS